MNRSSFDEFLTVVTNRVWEYLPECFSDARFELSTVAKNNGFVLTGLVIRSNTSNTSPVIYYVMLAQDETGVASIPVTFKLMETWEVEVDTLHELALQNLTRLFPTTFVSMSSMLRGLLPAIEDDDSSDGLFTPDDMMFILTSVQKLNGAANILDKAMMDRILDKFGSDFYLLPSSIHEWILVSDTGLNPTFLTSMVREVNAGEVALEERLSSHVYRYTASEGLICA